MKMVKNLMKMVFASMHKSQRAPHVSLRGAAATPLATGASENNTNYEENKMFLPSATIATLMMLGALHVRRIYDEKQTAEFLRQGKEPEFATDAKATFMQILPLRFISRTWGSLTSVELPTWSRSYVYKGWARAFKSDLFEIEKPLEDYASLRDFFARGLKKGSRPLDPNPACLLSPVDGIIMSCGQVKEPGTMINQIKGFSFSLAALLGTEPPPSQSHDVEHIPSMQLTHGSTSQTRRWLKFWPKSGSTPDSISYHSHHSNKQLFYCVLYLGPGDYHRVHSPANWCIDVRRHFPGHLYPVNMRAVQTIKNLYSVNERVILEGQWPQGFFTMALVGAANVGSIEVKVEPELKTNVPKFPSSSGSSLSIRVYGNEKRKRCVKRGDEVAVFNMGSTVVLVFQAPGSISIDNEYHGNSPAASALKGFQFSVEKGQRVRVGQAIGK